MDDQPRQLGLIDAVAIVVGTVLGPGVFLLESRAPAVMWIATGLLVLCGGAAFAELAAMMPESGGPYVFLREAYGSLFAFLFGWTFFFVVAGAMIAWLATIFAAGFPLGTGAARAVAALLIGVLTWVNHRGSRAGARAQIMFAAVQVAAVSLAMAYGSNTLQPPLRALDLMACLPAFVGWAALSFVAGEVRHPGRNIPRAFLIGLGVCTLLYALPVDPSTRLRPIAMILALGAANGWVMTAPWISFAQARDHLFFRRFGEIHPRYGTPSVAILMQGVWAATLAITGLHVSLLAYAGLVAWFFFGMTSLAVMVLRRRSPYRVRPYRMWGYPATLIPFLVLAFGSVIYTVIAAPKTALTGILMTGTGVAAYYIWRRFLR